MNGDLVIQPLEFNDEQKTLIKRMCQAEGLDDNEFTVFIHICQKRRLDPILRQIYATKRNKKVKDPKDGSEKWVKILVPIVAIEGMTAIADRTKTYAPSEKKPEFEYALDPKAKPPVSCTVWIKKFVQGTWHEFPFTGYFDEFVQPTDLWAKMPKHMLMKCCRASALRMGWPEDCGGLYIEEEWAPDTIDMSQEPQKRKERERGAIGKLKQSKEENRGHGNEGMEGGCMGDDDPADQYHTNIINVALKVKGEKKWVEAKVQGGKANIWSVQALAYKEEEIPPTTLYCWHQSLFDVLMQKPQKVVLKVENKPSGKFSPVIEDILSVNDVRYEKGKPVVAPEVAEMPTPKAESSAGTKEKRTESILKLTNAFEKVWPAVKTDLRPLRNKVGQKLLNLQNKEQLNDLTYPQVNIDVAIKVLEEFSKIDPRPSTDDGVLNDIEYLLKKYALTPVIEDLFA